MPQAVAKSPTPDESILWSIPWGHHALLLEKVTPAAFPGCFTVALLLPRESAKRPSGP
jgi:hypothetical protein